MPTSLDTDLFAGFGIDLPAATVVDARERLEPTAESMNALMKAKAAHAGMFDYYERRRRARNYLWGDQWSDEMEDDDGTTTTEDAYIRSKGRVPWRMNHLAPTVRNLKGQYRQNRSERAAFAVDREDEGQAEMMTQALRAVRRINRMTTLEAAGFQEMLMSGLVAFRVGYAYLPRLQREDVRIERVPMSRFFMNADAQDPRMDDLRVVGMIHDMTPGDVLEAFSEGDPAREEALREIMGIQEGYQYDAYTDASSSTGFDYADTTFESPSGIGRHRVVEVWERVTVREITAHDPITGSYGVVDATEAELAREQEVRALQGLPALATQRRYVSAWRGWFVTASGNTLWSGMSPYAHREHPFVVGVGDFIDGRPKGIVDDLIEQQRLYNRQIAVLDQVLASQARGVLMIPEEMIPEGVAPEDFADSYTRVNGLIVYKAIHEGKPLPNGVRPEQIFNQSLPAGAFEWLATMRDNIEYTSGVRGAMLGEAPKSGTSGVMHAQMITQGTLTTVDYFDSYFETVRELDGKQVAVIAQYYDGTRPLRTDDGRVVMFDPEKVRDIPFDVAVANVADTATARLLYEDDIAAFLDKGLLNFPQYLEITSHPKAAAIQSVLQRTNPAFGGTPEAQAAVLAAAMAGDPAAQQMAVQAGLGDPAEAAQQIASQTAQA